MSRVRRAVQIGPVGHLDGAGALAVSVRAQDGLLQVLLRTQARVTAPAEHDGAEHGEDDDGEDDQRERIHATTLPGPRRPVNIRRDG